MASHSSLLYSAAAVRRMLGVQSTAPVQMREFFDVLWVWVKGNRPTFISKSAFKHHFVEHRKEAAQTLDVVPWQYPSTRYTVCNDRQGSAYVIDCYSTAIDCTCEDYRQQLLTFGKGCCKHGYAVLNYLGFDSLQDYVNAHAQTNKLNSATADSTPVVPTPYAA